MRRLILLLCMLPLFAEAQNWRGIVPGDTAYYMVNGVPPYYSLHTRYVRVNWIDSVRSVGGDSIYYFVPSFRIPLVTAGCIDTSFSHWMGKRMVRKSGGTELYFNTYGDTITIPTYAGIGYSWLMARDTAGHVIHGTITASGIQQVDGGTDSIKTITLTVDSNGSLVNHFYTTKTFMLSKDHGWLQCFEWSGFPNQLSSTPNAGAHHFPDLHRRIEKRFSGLSFDQVDMAWKYAPGNDWIYQENRTWFQGQQYLWVVTHDSVLAAVPISPDKYLVTFRTRKFVKERLLAANPPKDTITLTDVTHIDTIAQAAANRIVVRSFWPETMPAIRFNHYHMPYRKYDLDTGICGLYHLGIWSYPNHGIIMRDSGCYREFHPLGDYEVGDTSFLEGFGAFSTFYYNTSIFGGIVYDIRHSYLHIGGCTWGQKDALGVDDPGMAPSTRRFTVRPNPANERLLITAERPGITARVRLMDATGRLRMDVPLEGQEVTLQTSDLAAGVYFIEIRAGSYREASRVVITK